MKASDLMGALESLIAKHGDCEVRLCAVGWENTEYYGFDSVSYKPGKPDSPYSDDRENFIELQG